VSTFCNSAKIAIIFRFGPINLFFLLKNLLPLCFCSCIVMVRCSFAHRGSLVGVSLDFLRLLSDFLRFAFVFLPTKKRHSDEP